MKNYIPASEGKTAEWLGNYASKLPAIGAACNMSDTDIKAMQALATDLIAEMANATATQAASKKATAVKNTKKIDNITAIRNNIAFLKASTNWTDAMGQDLQAEGTARHFDPATYKAKLSGSVNGGAVQLRLKKAGAQTINIYTRTGNSGAFVFLERVILSTYTDKRPLATPGVLEIRQYQTMGVVSDKEIGLPSDILTINFGG